jgi:ribonuclease-3
MLDTQVFKGLTEAALKTQLPALVKAWKLDFKNPALLAQALTHSSYIHENPEAGVSNERLEFLGDSVLGLAVSETLMLRGTKLSEGELSRMKSYFVSEATLAEQARKVSLGQCLRMGKGERTSGGADREAGLADVVEAVIGALFLDQGFAAAAKLVRENILPELSVAEDGWDALARTLLEKDAKSRLQEFFQQEGLGTPRYVCTNAAEASSVGPFEMSLFVGDVLLDKETSASKRDATQAIARRLLAMSPPDLVRFVAKQKGFMTSGTPT